MVSLANFEDSGVSLVPAGKMDHHPWRPVHRPPWLSQGALLQALPIRPKVGVTTPPFGAELYDEVIGGEIPRAERIRGGSIGSIPW